MNEIKNIGYVVYSMVDEKGLKAVWSFFDTEGSLTTGTGEAILKKSGAAPFVGEYIVTYYPEGVESVQFDLKISQSEGAENTYELQWLQKGELLIVGCGGVVDGKLSAGWRYLTE